MTAEDKTVLTLIGSGRAWNSALRDKDGNIIPAEDREFLTGDFVHNIHSDASLTLGTKIDDIVKPGRLWDLVSPDETPDWVASEDPVLADQLALHWGGIEVRPMPGTDGDA